MTVGRSDPLPPESLALQPFAPVAYYDSYMDCIRVFILDRSVTEVRIDDTLTLYQTNHATPFDPLNVGFCIKGVKHLFTELGLPMEGVVTLTEIINTLVKQRPGTTVSKILSEWPEGELTVNLREDEARAA